MRLLGAADRQTAAIWATATGGNIPRFLRWSYFNGIYQARINNVVLLT